jgi:hypothetical protein
MYNIFGLQDAKSTLNRAGSRKQEAAGQGCVCFASTTSNRLSPFSLVPLCAQRFLPPGCEIGTKWSRKCEMARLKSPAVFTSLPTASHHLSPSHRRRPFVTALLASRMRIELKSRNAKRQRRRAPLFYLPLTASILIHGLLPFPAAPCLCTWYFRLS